MMIVGGIVNDQYERLNLNDVIDAHPERALLQQILIDPGLVSTLLGDGCYIAGGFGRSLMRGDAIGAYLKGDRGPLGRAPAGDIDIFFEDPSKAESHRFKFMSTFRSFGGNALEIHNQNMRIQLVDSEKLILPMEEQLQRFDFTNACVGITRDHVFVNSRFKEIEADRRLDVKNNTSPFMGSRIMKYFKHRGIAGVTPRSEPLITEWIMRALCEDFDESVIRRIESKGLSHSIQSILRERNLTRPDDLLLVLGKFKETTREKYGLIVEVDFALSQLKERGYEVTVPAA